MTWKLPASLVPALALLGPGWTAFAQGPGMPGPPGGFGPGTFLAPQIVAKADADKDQKISPGEAGSFAAALVRSADETKVGSIDARAFSLAINKSLPSPPGPDGAAPPADFGPGTFFGPRLFEAADADRDNRLTPVEAEKIAREFILASDARKEGGLSSGALAEAINRRMGPMGQERQVVKDFDKDGDGRLNADERRAARASLKKEGGPRRGPFGIGPPGGGPGGPPGPGRPRFGPQDEPGKPGPKVAKGDVRPIPDKPLYDRATLRTLFLDFDTEGWESEMADFNLHFARTDGCQVARGLR